MQYDLKPQKKPTTKHQALPPCPTVPELPDYLRVRWGFPPGWKQNPPAALPPVEIHNIIVWVQN